MQKPTYLNQLKLDMDTFLRVGKDCEAPEDQKRNEEVLGHFYDQVCNYHETVKS